MGVSQSKEALNTVTIMRNGTRHQDRPRAVVGDATGPVRRLTVDRIRPADVARFVRGGGQHLDLTLDPEAVARMANARDDLTAAAARGTVYGRNTGLGALRHVSKDDFGPPGESARRLWRSHAAGIGPELDDATARATMLIRLKQLSQGGSGVDPALAVALAQALAAGAVPRLHAYGGVGTGDLTVLAELALTLAGELPWRTGDQPNAPVADGDGLPFLSSNAMTAAVGSLALVDTAAIARICERVAALSHLALRGAHQAYDARVFAGKDDPLAEESAARLRALLDDGGPARDAARVQDPFGLRTVPQVHSVLEAALRAAEQAFAAEIDAKAENPLIVDGVALHHGQFLTQRIAATLDAVRAAAQPALILSVARLGALLDPRLTGLPAFLADGLAGSSGLMVLEYVASDLLSRVDLLTTPATSTRTVVSLGLEEHVSHSTQGAWTCRLLADLAPDLLACELVAAVRALRHDPSRLVDCPAVQLFHEAGAVIPAHAADHVLGAELRGASALLTRLAAAETS
jgi:histidine ammonia-lyase